MSLCLLPALLAQLAALPPAAPARRLQESAERLLDRAHVRYGAVAVVHVPDARVLALVGRSTAEPELGADELALRPWAPAASIFKLVTAAALLDARGVSPGTRVCFHGGMHALLPIHLLDVPRLDRDCETLAWALAHSQNAIIAKLAHRFLDPEILGRYAQALGFGQEIPFARTLLPSVARLPAPPLEFARTAAGFWNTSLSPLHAALLANAIAAGGWFRAPGGAPQRAFGPLAAQALGAMMTGTTRFGTARGAFHDERGRPLLPYPVAGKTGTLSRAAPYLGYSWFVGFAPAERPQIAFAVLIGNGRDRAVRAATLAARLLEGYEPGGLVASR